MQITFDNHPGGRRASAEKWRRKNQRHLSFKFKLKQEL
jgi:hypothetical protein